MCAYSCHVVHRMPHMRSTSMRCTSRLRLSFLLFGGCLLLRQTVACPFPSPFSLSSIPCLYAIHLPHPTTISCFHVSHLLCHLLKSFTHHITLACLVRNVFLLPPLLMFLCRAWMSNSSNKVSTEPFGALSTVRHFF